jgi:hypothetical protein
MEITEREIADLLEKSIEEIVALKTDKPDIYELLQYGTMCHQLSLTEEDLKEYARTHPKETVLYFR